MSELLRGAYDLHIHTAPDVSPCKCDDLELARHLQTAGMAGCAIKRHITDTAGRAAVLKALFPDLDIAGGITLNYSVGGINPRAAERTAQMGGKMLWFPSWQRYRHGDDGTDFTSFLTVLGQEERLLPRVYEVLDVAASYRMVEGTGYLSAQEGKVWLWFGPSGDRSLA